jgi:ubiquinone/menaquinone biosynthesis C-methylase UbiE
MAAFGMSAFDAMAPDFDRLRRLPGDVPPAIRNAILAAIPHATRPLLLDLGAGSGRIGAAFVAASDRYVAVDVSFGMLRAFAARWPASPLVQADGERLPFADATFDAVLLMQVVNGARDWRGLLTEAMRVVRCGGGIILGRRVAPKDGIDARMRCQLAGALATLGVEAGRNEASDCATRWLAERDWEVCIATVATWTARCTPHAFLERHATGARFSVLPPPIRDTAMLRLREWAVATFGSLDAGFAEPFRYDLVIARPQSGVSC